MKPIKECQYDIHTHKRVYPAWIKRIWVGGEDFGHTHDILKRHGLHTVCQSARCPNQSECWRSRTATFMVLGNVCTRNCKYCSVRNGTPLAVEQDEPERIAAAVSELGVQHVVITSVTRDDLPDGGAAHFAKAVNKIRDTDPDITVELLTPDFKGSREALDLVLESGPDVFGHNIETVQRLYPVLRGVGAEYDRSVHVLEYAATNSTGIVKSGLMVGLGESEAEVHDTLKNLLRVGCTAVTIGQYLSPSANQVPVYEYIEPEKFEAYEQYAIHLGFHFAVAGPFVRSSYRAGEMMKTVRNRNSLGTVRSK